MDNINSIEKHIMEIFRWLCKQPPKIQINQLFDKMKIQFPEITDDEWKQIDLFLLGFNKGYNIAKKNYKSQNKLFFQDIEDFFFSEPDEDENIKFHHWRIKSFIQSYPQLIQKKVVFANNVQDRKEENALEKTMHKKNTSVHNIQSDEEKFEKLEISEASKKKETIVYAMKELTDKGEENKDTVYTNIQTNNQRDEENDRQNQEVSILTKEEGTIINPALELTDEIKAIDTGKQNNSETYEEYIENLNSFNSGKEDEPVQIDSIWKYIAVQEELDKHDEDYCYGENLKEDLKIIGARVRGKKHKHDGTNCDDWFEFATSGEWNIIAVSDGAGSKKFSRVGARISCETAVKYLAEHLKDYIIKEKEEWSSIIKKEEDIERFLQEKLKFVREKLYEAINRAYEAIEEAAKTREHSEAHNNLPGDRLITVNDLSATLLIVVHTLVKDKDNEYSVGLTWQVGDGITFIIDINGNLQLLGIPDTGEFSGETEFLTSKKKLLPENLINKTCHYICPIRVLMVMSDGVADDYFPNNPELLKLYGDLVLNGIIDIKGCSKEEIEQTLLNTKLQTLEEVKRTDFSLYGEQVTKNGVFRFSIQSIEKYAEKLGLSIQDVVKSPPLLLAGRKNLAGIKQYTAKDKLKYWLDSYHVRGSFDDRTLVVLYKEN